MKQIVKMIYTFFRTLYVYKLVLLGNLEFHLLEINDDDLLDLLSDGDDNGVVKPKGKSDCIIPPAKAVNSQDNANLIPVSLPQHSLNSDEVSLESNKEDITIPYEPSAPVSNPAVSKATGVRPILKTPTHAGISQLERKKSSVHFVEKQPESAQIKEDNSKSNSCKKSIDFRDGKPTESLVSQILLQIVLLYHQQLLLFRTCL